MLNLNRLADFTTVNEIRLRVVPVVTDAISKAQGATDLRPPDRVPLLELANGIDDADLRGAILRLAAHAESEPPAN